MAELKELSSVQPTDTPQSPPPQTWDGTGGIPWLHLADSLPPALTDADVACMWKHMQTSSWLSVTERSSVLLVEASDGLYLVNKAFIAGLAKQFETDAENMCAVLTRDLKAKVASKTALSIASNACVTGSSLSGSAAAATAEEDWEEDGPPAKGGKKRNTTIKGKKVSKKSVRVASNKTESGGGGGGSSSLGAESVSVETLIAPYIAEERLLRLLREWCANLLAFTSIKGTGGDDDEAVGGEMAPMLEGTEL